MAPRERTRLDAVLQREGSAWSTRDVRSGESVVLTTPALTFDVDAVYSALDGL